jgi:hypothetical protein
MTISPVHHPKLGALPRFQLTDQQHHTVNSHYKPHFPQSGHIGSLLMIIRVLDTVT